MNQSSINLSHQVISTLPPITKKEIETMPVAEIIQTSEILQSTPPDVRPTENDLISAGYLGPGGVTTLTEASENSNLSEGVKDYVKEQAGELVKDTIGAGLIGVGSWLANPIGPEDLASPSPVDEIIGIGLIWTGRFIMWI